MVGETVEEAALTDEQVNIGTFIEEFKDSISAQVTQLYEPIYQPGDTTPLPPLLRTPLGRQDDAIRAAATSLQRERGTTIVGEMGTGKTFISCAAAYTAGMRTVLVLCPPHLVKKWKREVEETVPNAHAIIVRSITEMEKIRRIQPRPLFVILSREKAKLGYKWQPAIVERWDRYASFGGKIKLAREAATGSGYKVICCPSCMKKQVDKDGVPLDYKFFEQRRRKCQQEDCKEPMWTADPTGPKRYPLAEYIKAHFPGFFDLLITDEVHEYKGGKSAQGLAAGTLAEASRKVLSLSGTLMGGYSSTLFHVLYRFATRQFREDFEHNEEGKWVTRYGFSETTIKKATDDAYDEDGKFTRGRKQSKTIREKPGLTPNALLHVIGSSIFLRLHDVAAGLPPYEEIIKTVPLDQTIVGTDTHSQASGYEALKEGMSEILRLYLSRGSKGFLARYLQGLLSYPETCWRGETVMDPESQQVVVAIPPLSEEHIYPKEQALIDLVAEEKANGRKVLCYITHTGVRDIRGRVATLLEKEGFKTAILDASVKPDKREAWVEDAVKQGCDVMLCHPRLVQTGLDLVQFPTIVWYETDYSVYTMRQASRRSWRIGQDNDVKVIYFAYSGTIQADALKLVARKTQSSLAVEGDLPEDGLATYGDSGDDLMIELAKRLVDGSTDGESLEDVFEQAHSDEADAETFLVGEEWSTAEEANIEDSGTRLALPSGAVEILDKDGNVISTEAEDDFFKQHFAVVKVEPRKSVKLTSSLCILCGEEYFLAAGRTCCDTSDTVPTGTPAVIENPWLPPQAAQDAAKRPKAVPKHPDAEERAPTPNEPVAPDDPILKKLVEVRPKRKAHPNQMNLFAAALGEGETAEIATDA